MTRYSDLSELRGELNAINQERDALKARGSDISDAMAERLDDLSDDAAKIESKIEDIEGDLASAERSADRADYHRRVL